MLPPSTDSTVPVTKLDASEARIHDRSLEIVWPPRPAERDLAKDLLLALLETRRIAARQEEARSDRVHEHVVLRPLDREVPRHVDDGALARVVGDRVMHLRDPCLAGLKPRRC